MLLYLVKVGDSPLPEKFKAKGARKMKVSYACIVALLILFIGGVWNTYAEHSFRCEQASREINIYEGMFSKGTLSRADADDFEETLRTYRKDLYC